MNLSAVGVYQISKRHTLQSTSALGGNQRVAKSPCVSLQRALISVDTHDILNIQSPKPLKLRKCTPTSTKSFSRRLAVEDPEGSGLELGSAQALLLPSVSLKSIPRLNAVAFTFQINPTALTLTKTRPPVRFPHANQGKALVDALARRAHIFRESNGL